MPYGDNSQLPLSVSGRLPVHAQDIYREAFNHAWLEYGQDEVVATRVAWAAVKRRYEKRRGRWVPLAATAGAVKGRSQQ
jgi:cation transport regulator